MIGTSGNWVSFVSKSSCQNRFGCFYSDQHHNQKTRKYLLPTTSFEVISSFCIRALLILRPTTLNKISSKSQGLVSSSPLEYFRESEMVWVGGTYKLTLFQLPSQHFPLKGPWATCHIIPDVTKHLFWNTALSYNCFLRNSTLRRTCNYWTDDLGIHFLPSEAVEAQLVIPSLKSGKGMGRCTKVTSMIWH